MDMVQEKNINDDELTQSWNWMVKSTRLNLFAKSMCHDTHSMNHLIILPLIFRP